jgi:hypothetical protein
MLRVPSHYVDLHRRFVKKLMSDGVVLYDDAFVFFCKKNEVRHLIMCKDRVLSRKWDKRSKFFWRSHQH